MMQGERLKEIGKQLSQIWHEMKMGYVDDTTTFLQEAVYCQVNINRIVFKGNQYLDADVSEYADKRKNMKYTIFRKECDYREPVPNKYINAIDNGNKMLRCPSCKCQISARPFSYAVGTRGYSFCPYCGKDVRAEGHDET